MSAPKTCMACWNGMHTRANDGSGSDCNNCGLPGPKPADGIWNGQPYTHYINHGNSWQTCPGEAAS